MYVIAARTDTEPWSLGEEPLDSIAEANQEIERFRKLYPVPSNVEIAVFELARVL